MKTPEEIKRELDDIGCCAQCDHYGCTWERPYGCPDAEKNLTAKQNALDLIAHLEAEIARRDKLLEVLGVSIPKGN